jgi:aspartate kinase
LADAAQFRKVREIIASDPERRVIVVSAPGKRAKDDVKVTDLLIQCARLRLDGRDAGGEIARVIQRYEEIAAALDLPAELAAGLREDLCHRLEGDTTHRGRFEDEIKSLGEAYSAQLMAAFLSATGIAAECATPKEAGLLVTEEYGNAQVLEESYSRLAALKARKRVTVFPGFFGHSREGHVVTFSRGGSDLTGAILAVAVHADVYENFTDVDGIATADPRLVDLPVLIRELTYQELRELSYGGFSVFHEEAMLPVLEAGIPINVRNTNNPSHPGTWVVVSRKATPGDIVGVACDHGFCGIYVDKYLMNREKGFGRKLLQIVEDEDLSFDHAPSGVDNMTVVLRQEELSGRTLDRIKERVYQELGADHVRVENDISLLSVVGDGMRHTVGIAARVTGALAAARSNIELIVQGPSELTMILGVKQADAAKAVDAIYREFFVERRIHWPTSPAPEPAGG